MSTTQDQSTRNLPFTLHKLNLELQVKLLRLLQENSQQWLDYSHRLLHDSISESDAAMQSLLDADDWRKLADLPNDAFWQKVQRRLSDSQAAMQALLKTQASFSTGAQQAMQAWQKDLTQILGAITQGQPQNPSGQNALQAWLQPWQWLQNPATPEPAKAEAKGKKPAQ